MSMRHTSGPWVHRVMTMPRKVWAALGRSEIQIVAKNGNVIAAVWCADDREGEKEANAQLISAAPDLLEALQYVNLIIAEAALNGFRWEAGDWTARLFHSQQKTSAAIEKATAAP